MAPVVFPILKDIVWISFVFVSLLYLLMKEMKRPPALRICSSGRRRIFCIVVFFCLYLATATVHFIHKHPLDILQHNIRNTFWYSPIILLLPLYLRDNADLIKVVRFLVFNGVIIALFGIFSRFVKPESLLLDNRVLSTLGNPNNLAFFLNILIFLTLSRILLEKKAGKVLTLLVLLFVVCVLLTISLTNILALLCGGVLLFLLTRKVKRGVGIFLFTGVSVIVLFHLGLLDGIVLKYDRMLDKSTTSRSYYGRVQQAQEIVEFLKNGSLASVAFGDFGLEQYKRYDSQYWNILRNDGLIALTGFLLIFLGAIRVGLKKAAIFAKTREYELSAILTGISVSLLTVVIVSFNGTAFLNRFPLNFFMYFLIGAVILVAVPRGKTVP